METPVSRLSILTPTNLIDAKEEFFTSGFTVAPRFRYTAALEEVEHLFCQGSNSVCSQYITEAQRILWRAKELTSNAEDAVASQVRSSEDVRALAEQYILSLKLEDCATVVVDKKLRNARVSEVHATGSGKATYVFSLPDSVMSTGQVQGMLDHELGTHLLRFRNDEVQPWHGVRKHFCLQNPHETEEGLATINQYMSAKSSLMYDAARQYFAASRGAHLGFVELFSELMPHSSSADACWRICCRVKQGLVDTSRLGALARGQTYFRGAVELLRNMQDMDLSLLYSGRLAFQDLPKVHGDAMLEAVIVPHFLDTPAKLKTYKEHCKAMLLENML